MAETKKIVLAEIDINVDGVITRQKEILAQQELLKKQQQAYNEEKKKGVEISDDQNEVFIKNQAALKNLSTEYNQNTRILQARQSVEENGIKTINDAKAALSAVSVEWARVTKIEGENSERSKELGAQKLALTDKLKELEKATGDNTRNVGNYESALDGLSGRLGVAGGFLKSFADGSNTVGGALKSLGGTMKLMITNPFFLIIGTLAGIFFTIKEAIGKNAEILDKLQVALKPVQLLFGAIMNTVGKLVEVLVGGFASAMESISDLFDGAENSTKKYTDAVKNLQDIEDKMINQKIKDKELQEKINNLDEIAADRTQTKEKRLNALTESIKLQKQIATENANLQSEQLKNFATDLQGTYGLKGQLVNKDLQLTQEALNKLSKEDKAALQTQIENYQNAKNKKSEIDKEASKKKSTLELGISQEEEAENQKRIEARKKSNEKYIKLLEYQVTYFKATNETKLKEGVRIDEKLIEAEIKRIEEVQRLETKANDDTYKRGLRDKQDYELKKIEIQKAADAERLNLANAQLEQIQSDLDLELRMFNVTNQSKLQNQKELTDALLADEVNRLVAIQEIERKKIENSKVSAEEKKVAILELEASTNQAITDLELQQAEQKKAAKIEQDLLFAETEKELKLNSLMGQFDVEKSELDRQFAEKYDKAKGNAELTLSLEKLYAQKKTEIARKELMAKADLASSFAGNIAEIFGKQTKVGKAAASAQVAIDTIKGSIAAFTAFSGMGPVGIVLGTAAAAAVAVKGARAIKDIWAVKSGLPENGGGGNQTSIPSQSDGGAGAPPIPPPNYDGGFANNNVGNGNSGTNTMPAFQPVLVIDEVTYKQNQIAKTQLVATS